jgi:hypothetical protein
MGFTHFQTMHLKALIVSQSTVPARRGIAIQADEPVSPTRSRLSGVPPGQSLPGPFHGVRDSTLHVRFLTQIRFR